MTHDPFSIMQLPGFWLGALAAREENDNLITKQSTNLHKLLSVAERGEDVTATDEFTQWLGYQRRS